MACPQCFTDGAPAETPDPGFETSSTNPGLDPTDQEVPESTTKAIELADHIFDAVAEGMEYIDSDKMQILCSVIFAEANIHDNHSTRTKLMRIMDTTPPFGRISRTELCLFVVLQLTAPAVPGVKKQPFAGLSVERLPAMLKRAKSAKLKFHPLFRAAENEEVESWFKKVKKLGEGQYAKVELWAIQESAPPTAKLELIGKEVAVKIFKKGGSSRRATYEVLSEFLLMKSLRRESGYACHQNVVKLHHLVETPTYMYILLEYVPGGTLYNLLRTYRRGLPEEDARAISQQMLEGIQFIHAHDIIHLDLKPENILCTNLEPPMTIKITDLGLSAVIVNRNVGLDKFPGSPMYLAPEIFSREVQYTEKADMWSFGAILHELLCGALPWSTVKTVKHLKDIVCGNLAKAKGPDGKHVYNPGYAGFWVREGRLLTRGTNKHGRNEWADKFTKAWDRKEVSLAARKAVARTLFPVHFKRYGASLMLSEDFYLNDGVQHDSFRFQKLHASSQEKRAFQSSELDTSEFRAVHQLAERFRMDIREDIRHGDFLPKFMVQKRPTHPTMSQELTYSMNTSSLNIFELDDAPASVFEKPTEKRALCDDCSVM